MNEFSIDDAGDVRLLPYVNLKDRSLARERDAFIVEGEHLVRRLLASRYPVQSVMVSRRRVGKFRDLMPEGVPLYVVSDAVMERVAGFKFHRGVMACGQRLPGPDIDAFMRDRSGDVCLVVCPNVSDPANLGAILRSCAAFGVDGVLVGSQAADPFARRVLRVSMGAVFALTVMVAADPAEALRALRDEYGVTCLATVLDPEAEPLPDVERPHRLALCLGGEAHGLGETTLAACDRRVTLPMHLRTDSLNVAVAAGVFLYHFTVVAGGR